MPKNLNDILKGVKKSSTNTLTTGDKPGVDYADKMKDGRDFVAQHSVEKHDDRNGNDEKVYKGSTKKAEMKRHGHEPMPKDIKVYNKTQQVGEEVELDEIKKPLANYVKKRGEEIKDWGDEDSIRRYNKQGVTVGDQAGKDVKAISNKFIAKAKSKLGEEIEEGKMCESCGKSPCGCDSDDEPRYGKKDKPGKKKLLTDKNIQEKLTKGMSAGDVIKDFQKSDDPRFAGDSKEKRKKRALAAYYKMQREDVNESISDQRSSRKTASEEAREKIHGALLKKKEREEKMKEEAAAAETPITLPVTNSREGFRV